MKLVELILFGVLLSFALGQIGRFPISEGVAFYLTDLLIPVLLFVWLALALAVKRKIFLPPLSRLIFVFFLVGVLSLLISTKSFTQAEVLTGSLFLVRWVEYALLYLVGYNLVLSLKNRSLLYSNFLIFVSVLVALAGFLQLKIIPDFTLIAEEGGWDPHQGRILSTFFDPNYVGLFFVLALVLVASKFLFVKNKVWKLFLGGVGFILLTATILTFSRSTYLAFFAAFAVLGLVKSRKLLIGLIIIVIVAYFSVTGVKDRVVNLIQGDLSSQARVVSWLNSLEIIKENFFIGVGFNNYRFAQAQKGLVDIASLGGHSGSGVDSSLLLVFATTGIFGLIIYLGLFLRTFYLAWLKRGNPYGLAVLGATVAILVHSQFVNSLFFPQIMGLYWVILAIGLI